jgi:hypothetical protein
MRSSFRKDLPKCPEGGSEFLGEELGLFPGGEVAASVELVVVDEVVGVGAFGPAAGAWYSSSGNTLMAKGMVMALASKKSAVVSQERRPAAGRRFVLRWRGRVVVVVVRRSRSP